MENLLFSLAHLALCLTFGLLLHGYDHLFWYLYLRWGHVVVSKDHICFKVMRIWLFASPLDCFCMAMTIYFGTYPLRWGLCVVSKDRIYFKVLRVRSLFLSFSCFFFTLMQE
ncbi:hypothetical protein ACH5RR_018213 [Cinchona calisaya]|uniref:Uncharacterized protein n=1 Tax=Cinchona calisaya TaxID=153742 RepID=A0ABD2ZKS4_9GENT